MYLSLVIPVYNEEESLPLLFDAIHKALDSLPRTWEVILVDDGSSDQSLNVLKTLAEKDPEHIRVVAFRRNFGQTAAMAAGIDHASGEIIVLLDADLQNDPADIPMMLEKLDEGYDVVSGWRVKRKDTFITRTLPSRMANGLISRVTGVELHDYGCTLKVYRREVLTGFKLYGEMHRFIPVFAHSVGAKIIEVPVNHHPRRFGETKYGLNRTLKVLLDLFTVKFLLDYSAKPIYLFGGAGFGIIAISTALLIFLAIRRIFFNISVFGSPLFQISAMFFILGFQSILMGLIAELQVRTYYESQRKPTYTLRETINIK
ncbi:MAG: glycosyltransferase family 2 protein [Anaerolineae bacterium]|jgi:glycosyltransferase involved in cell wall biosynthesis|nr:glycosyltransferase family 2 protein [Anaerolineae bacterium]MBT4310081.1 glycosyltransferase family 2 protein [Anaerolineae bacterium]MBT4457620.1 glycosyltransferase family 2 protein [Anaerolineae bacterium]MBT4841115.1 glycosyltransferase family 2 protein [Anaerolineae bacterium]MBT6062306.1 glycosyltransferase family 2 protein [Anaerolineae bacterium]